MRFHKIVTLIATDKMQIPIFYTSCSSYKHLLHYSKFSRREMLKKLKFMVNRKSWKTVDKRTNQGDAWMHTGSPPGTQQKQGS